VPPYWEVIVLNAALDIIIKNNLTECAEGIEKYNIPTLSFDLK